jgi:hypothetical protein
MEHINIKISDDSDNNSINSGDELLSIFSDITDENIINENNIDEKKNINNLLKKTCKMVGERYEIIKNMYDISDRIGKNNLKKKHPFLKHKDNRLMFHEILRLCDDDLNEDEKNILIKYRRDCIKGVYKHIQSKKTAIANIIISEGLKKGKFIIALAKNTLIANEQWFLRLVSDLENSYKHTNIKEIIAVLTSEASNLNGKATHFNKVDKLICSLIRPNNKIKLLFICSNQIRINDIIKILESNLSLSDEKQQSFEIYYDEAHNNKDGIIPNLRYIEHMFMFPYLDNIYPITGTPEDLFNLNSNSSIMKKNYDNNTENNYFWKKNLLEQNAFNYTPFCDLTSLSSGYSSFKDAIPINFESIKQDPMFSNYDDVNFKIDLFKHCHPNISNEEEIDKKIGVEHSRFMKNERDAYIIGKNIIDNYITKTFTHNQELHEDEKLFLKGEFNLHIINTPKRIIFTVSLIDYLLDKDYEPVCIGLYTLQDPQKKKIGTVNVWFKHNGEIKTISYERDINSNNEKLETNNKIDKIISYMENTYNISKDRPYIVVGNYEQTGESITFVNSSYGMVRSTTVLPSSEITKYKDPQVYGRINAVLDRFLEKNPNFVVPPKFMLGYEKNIQNALDNEAANDLRIQLFKEMLEGTVENPPDINERLKFEKHKSENDGNIIAYPVKIEINDIRDTRIEELFELFKKDKRSPFFNKILEIIDDCYHDGTIDITDNMGKFIDKENRRIRDIFSIYGVRTFSKDKEHKPDGYNIEHYVDCHNNNIQYTNDKKKMSKNQCQLEVCITKYEKMIDGKKFINWPKTLWLGYKY